MSSEGSRDWHELVEIVRRMSAEISRLEFGSPVTHVYNPLDYAWDCHQEYLRRYGPGPVGRTIFLGMNPGPWGMAQTGVPFGEIGLVSEWLGISGAVGRPAHEHPKRLVEGFSCHRHEVSGSRLWGWARDQFGTPEEFFKRFFVANYCPLMFLEESGRNRTPDRLPVGERTAMLQICDEALRQMIDAIQPEWVIGVGRYATNRASEALAGVEVQIGQILHPSPASPAANRDWQGQAVAQLTALGVPL